MGHARRMAVDRVVQVVIGATLAGTFRGTFGTASAEARKLGSTIKALDLHGLM